MTKLPHNSPKLEYSDWLIKFVTPIRCSIHTSAREKNIDANQSGIQSITRSSKRVCFLFKNQKIHRTRIGTIYQRNPVYVPFSTIRVLLFLISFLTLSSSVFAQQIQGESRFIRQLDAVSWNFNNIVSSKGTSYDLSLQNTFNSRLFLFNEQAQNIQDEHNARLILMYDFNPSFGVSASARSFTFTNTSLRQDVGFLGFYYRPLQLATISPSIGFMSDERSDRQDRGLAWSLQVDFEPLKVGETDIYPMFSSEIANIEPRKFVTTRYGTRTRYRFDDIFELSTELWVRNARRDSYQSSSLLNRAETNFVESIESDTLMGAVSVRTPLNPKISSTIDVYAMNNIRKVTNFSIDDSENLQLFNSRSLRQNLDIIVGFDYPVRRSHLNAGFAWSMQIRDAQLIDTDGLPADQVVRNTQILQNSNYNQRRFEVFTRNLLHFGPRYSLDLLANSTILRYDTPEINRDDRDEFSIHIRTLHRYRFSDEFSASLTLAGEAYHYVYLFSERSIENNWRRSIRLIPEIEWRPNERFHLRQRFLVRANYTVEDYEIPGRQKNDQSAREMVFITNSKWNFLPGWSMETDISRSELRIGRLFWDTFQETPLDTLVTYDVQNMISRRFGDVIVSSGVRYFRKIDFLQRATAEITIEENGEIIRESRIATGQQTTVQWGPAVMVLLPLSSRNELYINGWMQHQVTWQRLYTTYPPELRSAFLRAERRTTRRTFPNLEITARFRF